MIGIQEICLCLLSCIQRNDSESSVEATDVRSSRNLTQSKHLKKPILKIDCSTVSHDCLSTGCLMFQHMHRPQKVILFSGNVIPAFAIFFSLLVWPQVSQAQTVHDFGSWFSLNTQGKVNRCDDECRLRWWFDGHLRYLDDTEGFHQSIFRPGVGYQITPNTNVWAGYAWINTLGPGRIEIIDEHRIWQQVMWTPKFEQFSFLARSRFEQRFLEIGDDMGLRFRQFFKIDRPFRCNSPNSFVIWNETFLDLNETDWGQQGRLGQNRLFLGLGKKLNGANKPKFEVGYLNQYVRNKPGDDRVNHILSLNWFFTF